MGNWVEEYASLRAEEEGEYRLGQRQVVSPDHQDGGPFFRSNEREWRLVRTTVCEHLGCRLDVTLLHLDYHWPGGLHSDDYWGRPDRIHRCLDPEGHSSELHCTISRVPLNWVTTHLSREQFRAEFG